MRSVPETWTFYQFSSLPHLSSLRVQLTAQVRSLNSPVQHAGKAGPPACQGRGEDRPGALRSAGQRGVAVLPPRALGNPATRWYHTKTTSVGRSGAQCRAQESQQVLPPERDLWAWWTGQCPPVPHPCSCSATVPTTLLLPPGHGRVPPREPPSPAGRGVSTEPCPGHLFL